MVDRPILFSAPMVLALLAGQKTMTRRILKPQPEQQKSRWHLHNAHGGCFVDTEAEGGAVAVDYAPYATGDRLWVRENFSGLHEYDQEGWPPAAWFPTDAIWYWADGNPEHGDWTKPKPSIHMPRWASRITLAVTAVRVQRVQDIDEQDAQAEGVEPRIAGQDEHGPIRTHRTGFVRIWREINGPDAWSANPWVAAITFDVHRANIGALPDRSAP